MPRFSFSKFVPVVLVASAFGAEIGPVQPPVTVHEWGTFTSVAGRDGQAVSWAPLAATSDLPCFVHQLGKGIVKFSPGLVRMETPVVYFYSPAPTKASVHVDFPEGWITEWYPKATRVFPNNPEAYGTLPNGGAMYEPKLGSIDWTDLSILPGSSTPLSVSRGASRYFAARATDSASVQSGDEAEKLLFYRGIGNFKVPVESVVEGSGVRLHAADGQILPVAILFANEGGRIGYRVVHNVRDGLIAAPEMNGSLDALRGELARALEQAGLYPKEAAAMVETWRDSWFEEGMRVLYIMPRAEVDRVLPLRVTPAPVDTQRVFVGRAEVVSPWAEKTIRTAMEAGDTATLARFGRFLTPFLAEIKTNGEVKQAGRLNLSANNPVAGSCVQ